LRQKGSHRQFEGIVNGETKLVTISQKDGEDVAPKLLGFIKRQSGLPKDLFRG
jgi:predicted RNA binding protein YcfA (HicA-like mRNA interferase family)